ncbi:SAF domain-containing protein [Microbacterium sp. YY-01]|uniref:SAF domain-containing protein n=1 Tax=Microbacterium sp. YY-01 TaxID=3421634 RepID=UPI003D16A708
MALPPKARRRAWNDVRFFVGIALVVVSIAAVWFVVSSARTTIPMLQASRTIVAGESLKSQDFRVVDVSLGAVAGQYLSPEQLTGDLVATRTLDKGELVPQAATAKADDGQRTMIVVESAVDISRTITAGSAVEVWHTPPAQRDDPAEAPRILVSEAVVSTVNRESSVMGSSRASIELAIDRSDIPGVLAAISAGSALWVVPAGGAS